MIYAWDRMEANGEPALWYSRFLVYRDLGPARTLLGAVHKTEAEEGGGRRSKKVPGAWDRMFSKWDWKVRAEAYDKHLQAEQEARAQALRELEAAEIERIMTTDYAAAHERVKALAAMAHIVEGSFIDPDTQKVNYKFMSPDKLKEWRGMLDDIAKETGGRVKLSKSELSGKDGGPVIIETQWGSTIIEKEEGKAE